MIKFIVKCIVLLFIFTFGVTFILEQNINENDQAKEEESHVLISSADLYSELEENEVTIQEELTEQESLTYHLAQWIEKSGLLIYESIITIVTDLASVI
ncbi:hypothetical protein ACS127_15350 [Amphibacillus sp. Q70]|uniref:hypothetical protein n=1 Tax=Amphibacillus sp. Q70 TaxID=3453416 RepID=UPI003F830C31